MKPVLLEKIKTLPQVPGVYLYKNAQGKIIYVGKAKNLRNRVKSYFQDNLDVWSKTKSLVDNINDIEYIEALSEFEALILEAELIKKYRPKYNTSLKDDKSYLYIVVRNERVYFDKKSVLMPKILTTRKSDILPKDIAFGPYPESATAKYIVRTIRKIFPFRDCSVSKFNRYKTLKRPCLYGHLGLCQAPCLLKNSAAFEHDLAKYRNDIGRIKKLLSGDSVQLIKSLNSLMNTAAKKQSFEEAAKYRDLLEKFEYVRQHYTSAQTYIENPYLVEDIISESLTELEKVIPSLSKKPQRIECYDISNISGKQAVGSMVVATDGRIDKREYRKFKIKKKDEPDDFEMLREVLRRRLQSGVAKSNWRLPDLIVIDGGKGQISAVLKVFNELGVTIPIIGLAKRFETIVIPKNPLQFEEIILDRSNEGLKLLQRLRDEAHRFAQKYHHLLRIKALDV